MTVAMTRYEKQCQNERKRHIAVSQCKICKSIIGSKDYITFEERYFHAQCLKKEDSKK